MAIEKFANVLNLHPENALLAAWRHTLERHAGRPAILSAWGATLRTFLDVEHEAGALAHHFAALRAPAVVALQLGNEPTWPALLLALFRAGHIPLPLGRHLARADLREAIALCGAAALVTAEGGPLRVDHRPETGNPATPDAEFLKLTSGTTGTARAVRFRAEHLVADGAQICDTMGFGPEDLNYAAIPLSHSYGFSNLLVPLLCRGVRMAISDDHMPRAILAGLEATGATVFPGTPVFFDKLAGLDHIPRLPRLRLCLSAGAPLAVTVATAFTRKFGLKIHTFYGSSECGGIAYDTDDAPEYEAGHLGTPMRGVEIARLDPAGDLGPIAVRSPAVGLGYWPEESSEALRGGRFIPGDLIRWTPRGLTLEGRVSDVINIAGRKLNPAEVEAQIAAYPGLRQAVVFGIPSALRGEEAVACVAGDHLNRAALQRFCHDHLSQWQRPRDFWIVDEIPANDRGKISRRALAAEYLAQPRKP